MPEEHWREILDRLRVLPERRQGRLQWDTVTLLIERRGEVLVALREIPVSAWRTASQPEFLANAARDQRLQLLQVAQKRYLCVWRRLPTDCDWLQALAAVQV